MTTIATSPGGTFYDEDVNGQDVDSYTLNVDSRNYFLLDETGVYNIKGWVDSGFGDSSDVIPIQVATGFKIESLQFQILNYVNYHQGSDIVVERSDGSYYATYSVQSFTASNVLEAGPYNVYFRRDAFDYSLTIDITAVPSNVLPTISGSSATVLVNDNQTATPFNGLQVFDADNDGGSITITHTAANGSLSGTGLTGSAGHYVLSGSTPAELTTRLKALVFTPTENQLTPGQTQATNFTLTPNDGTADGNGFTGITTSALSVNNTPTALALSANAVAHSDGTGAVDVGTFSTTDADVGESFTYALVAGDGDTHNGLFSVVGNTLRVNSLQDTPSGTYSVRVQTTDASGGQFAQAYSVTVTDDVLPTVSQIQLSTQQLLAADIGASGFELSVTFSEAMDTAVTPTFTFPGHDLSQILELASGGWENGGTVYKATYNVLDEAVELSGIPVRLAGAQDASGNTLASPVDASTTFSIDTQVPQFMSAMPADDSASVAPNADISLTFSQAIIAGSGDVVIYDMTTSAELERVQASSLNGLGTSMVSWSPSAALPGNHDLVIRWEASAFTDAAGNPVAANAGNTLVNFTVANTPATASLSVVDVGQSDAGEATHELTVTYQDTDGTIDAVSLDTGDIVVTRDGQALTTTGMVVQSGANTATTTVVYTITAPGGTWDDTDNGTYTVTLANNAVLDDKGAGIVAGELGSFSVSLDTTAPATPGAPVLAVGEDTGVSAGDGITAEQTPTLQGGQAEANSTITLVSDRDGVIGTTMVDVLGNWQLTPATALSEGAHQIHVTSMDAANNVSSASNSVTVTIDSMAPAQPSAPALANGMDSGTSSNDQWTQQAQPTIQGSAEADARITVTSDQDGVLGTVLADGAGNWSLTPGTPLSEGGHSLTVVASDVAGNDSISSQALMVVIDTTAPTLNTATSSPANGALPVPVDENLTLAFSEAVYLGSGSIRLVEDATGTTVASWSVADVNSRLTGNGTNQLVLSLSEALAAETRYRIETDASALEDGAGNTLPAVGDGTLEFTTEIPGALYTTASGFNTLTGAGLLGNATVDGGDNTIIVTDHTHLSGATLDGGAGQNRVLLSGNSQADFSLASLVSHIDSILVTSANGFEVIFGATSGWQGVTSFTGNGNTSLNLALGEAIDISERSIAGIDQLDVDTGGGALTMTGSQLSALNAANGFLRTDPTHGEIELLLTGSEADAAQLSLIFNGFSQITMQEVGDTTLTIEPIQLLIGGSYRTQDAAGADTLRSQDAALDLSLAMLEGWDTLENIQLGSAKTRITSEQLQGLNQVVHADADGDDVLEVSGVAVDASGLTVTNIDTLSLLDDGAVLRLATQTASQFTTLRAEGLGTETLQGTTATLDVSAVQNIVGFEALETTHLGDATLTVSDVSQFTTYRAHSEFENTLNSRGSDVNLTGLTFAHIGRFTTSNNEGVRFTGTSAVETMEGGSGDDVFSGGGGADIFTGGAGADRFMASDSITVTDFSNQDTLRVAGAAGMTAAQLSFSSGVLTIDTNADGDDTSVTPEDVVKVSLGNLRGRFQVTDAGADADITFTPTTGGGGGTPTPTPTPPTQEDGATVVRQNEGGVSTVTVEPVSVSRQEDPNTANGSLADIMLAQDDDGGMALQVGLPAGVGLQSDGHDRRMSRDEALDDLIARIAAKTESDNEQREAMSGIGRSFLDALPNEGALIVRTITPTIAEGVRSVAPVVISGSSSTDRQEALVIDVSQLPRGTVLRLEDVEFAAIVGEARIIGGSGSNTVVGDNSAQIIVLGEDDDVLYGGGGDDIVGSEGGNDRLFGGDGNDEVFGGAGADLLHGGRDTDVASYEGNRDEYDVSLLHGVITVTLKDDPSDVDTLVNIEQLRFADGEESVVYSNDIGWIAGLYGQVLGRQGDVDGVQYWAQMYDEGLGRADMAMLFVNSLEAGEQLSVQNSNTEAMLETLYQALLGRESDSAGKAYWLEQLALGGGLRDVVEGFMASDEMRSHDLISTQWDFIA